MEYFSSDSTLFYRQHVPVSTLVYVSSSIALLYDQNIKNNSQSTSYLSLLKAHAVHGLSLERFQSGTLHVAQKVPIIKGFHCSYKIVP